MIGTELPVVDREPGAGPEEARLPRLEVADLTVRAVDPFGVDLRDVHLTVHAGEIVGVAGVSGNGQKELLAVLSGETLVDDAGAIRMLGRPVARAAPGARRRLGLAFVPEERLGRGAVPTMSLTENALLTAHRQGMVRLGFARLGRARAFTRACLERFGVRSAGPQAPARSLSGGTSRSSSSGARSRSGRSS